MKTSMRILFNNKNDKALFLLSIVMGLVCLSLWLHITFFIDMQEQAFGEKWVFAEIVFLTIPKNVLNAEFDIVFEFKFITLLSFFGILYWILGSEYLRKFFIKMSILLRRLFFSFSIACTLICTYEVIWTFALWNAKITASAIQNPKIMSFDIDKLAYLNPIYPVNLNFSTKIFSLALFASIYSIYYFYSLSHVGDYSSKNR